MKLKKNQINHLLSKIKSTSVDSLQLKVRVDYIAYEYINKIFKQYGSHKAFSEASFKLKNANPNQNLTSSILRNQIESMKLNDSIFITSVRKVPSNTKLPKNREDKIYYDAEFTIDINVSRFILDIKDLYLILNESDIYGETHSLLTGKPQNLMCLLALVYGQQNENVLMKLTSIIMKDKNKYISLIINKYTRMLKHLHPMQISIDIIYEAIVYYISKIFTYSAIPIYEISISDICISAPIIQKENILNDGREINIMDIINIILDYSICATNYISIDMKKEYKSSLDRDAENMMKEFYNSFLPKSKRQIQSTTDFNTIETNYRGVYKPCGEEYLNGGYAFYTISENIFKNDKISYTKGSYRNRTYGLLLQPEVLYTEFPNKFPEGETPQVFVMTIKPQSLNKFLRKIPTLYDLKFKLYDSYSTRLSRMCNFNPMEDTDSHYLSQMYFKSLEQDENLVSYLDEYNKRINSNNYINISDMCKVAIKGFILDPLYFILKTKKNLRLLQETTIITYLNYFVNIPRDIETMVEKVFKEFINILYNHNISEEIISAVRGIKSIKELLEYTGNQQILSSYYFQDILISLIFDRMPKIDITFVKKSMQFFFMQKLNYYITNKDLKLDGKVDINRYRKMSKIIHRISMNKLLERNLITYDYYLNETNRTDVDNDYKLQSIEDEKMFDITNLTGILMDIVSEALAVEEIELYE